MNPKALQLKDFEVRTRRELDTVRVMIGMYCHDHHDPSPKDLCAYCEDLWAYAQKRVIHCRYGIDKPTCFNCPTHCYKPDRKDHMRQHMRYAGPRMALRHPYLALLHWIDGRADARRAKKARSGRTEADSR